jgi:tryptophan 2,3-dioxygenase
LPESKDRPYQSPIVERPLEEALEELNARFGKRAVEQVEAALVRKELTYDDYIETRTLLSLQTTLTDHHDEFIFKVYHQQTELWFRLALHEIERAIRSLIAPKNNLVDAIDAVTRINRYFSILTQSFSVLLDGLSSDEFLIYRKAFGTSSGFQSSQFRAIEILCGLERDASKRTDVSAESRPANERQETKVSAEEQATFYWERAARHLTTNEPTLTLTKFKEQHLAYLNRLYADRKPYSLRLAFDLLVRGGSDSPASIEAYDRIFCENVSDPMQLLADQLLQLDDAIVTWKQMHLRVAAKHLARAPKGTGETNWAEYLARSIAEQRCFPELRNARTRTLTTKVTTG